MERRAEHRDDARGERPLGEEAPQEVRDAVGHEERVGDGPRTERARDDDVPRVAEDPARERGQPDGPHCAHHAALHRVIRMGAVRIAQGAKLPGAGPMGSTIRTP